MNRVCSFIIAAAMSFVLLVPAGMAAEVLNTTQMDTVTAGYAPSSTWGLHMLNPLPQSNPNSSLLRTAPSVSYESYGALRQNAFNAATHNMGNSGSSALIRGSHSGTCTVVINGQSAC